MMHHLRRLARIGAGLLLGSTIVATPIGASAAPALSATEPYLVVYKQSSVPSDAGSVIAAAGGRLVYSYDAIGVAVASSSSAVFRDQLLRDSRVEGASATSRFASRLDRGKLDTGSAAAVTAGTPAPGSDALSSRQWDMDLIQAPAARAITGGSPDIVVGDIDTGLDYTHPDLAPNVDFANSVSCIGGAPNQSPAAWKDDEGHGTHTAGTIAAAKNGLGIVGVAPNVKIAAIKAGNGDGFFFPGEVVCAFMWAATHNAIKVTNNSYFADPWLFNCKNDPEQRAIWQAEQRAIRFAIQRGVTVVASAGNQADDLAHPTQDATSPDNTTPVTRDISNACAVVPVEVPGVVGVSAEGVLGQKSFYSSYGHGAVTVVAPGGDSILQVTPAAPNGRVLSTYPNYRPCLRPVVDPSGATYCYLQGTSMAGPHVAGVAALIASELGSKATPGAVQSLIRRTADPKACPADTSDYDFFPAVDGGAPQTCQGGLGSNSWYGAGQLNALSAVIAAMR
jgi:subtilisin family serine protease